MTTENQNQPNGVPPASGNAAVSPNGGGNPPAGTHTQNQPQNTGLEAAIASLVEVLKPADQTAAPANAGGLNALDLSSIDDPALRSMASVMLSLGKGIDMDRVFGKALEHGDASLLDLAYLREKGGANAEQLSTLAQSIVTTMNAQVESQTKAIYDMAGGEKQWQESTTAFNSKAPDALRTVVKQMLDSGVSAQVKAAAQLVVEFAKGNGLVTNQQPDLSFGGAAPAGGQGLSKVEFQTELNKLDQYARDYPQKRDDLFARRALGKSLGK